MKQFTCEYNIDTACEELRSGSTVILAVDCIAVEDQLAHLQRPAGIPGAGPVRRDRGLSAQVHRLFPAGLIPHCLGPLEQDMLLAPGPG